METVHTAVVLAAIVGFLVVAAAAFLTETQANRALARGDDPALVWTRFGWVCVTVVGFFIMVVLAAAVVTIWLT